MLEKVSLADALPCPPPDLFPQPVVGQQALDDLSQPVHVAVGYQVPGHPVLDDFQRAAVGPTDNGLAERHRLQKYQPESLPTAGHGEDVAAAIRGCELFTGNITHEMGVLPYLQLLRQTLQTRSIGAATDHDEVEVGKRVKVPRRRLDEYSNV